MEIMHRVALSLLHMVTRFTEACVIVNIRVRASWSLTWNSFPDWWNDQQGIFSAKTIIVEAFLIFAAVIKCLVQI